MPRKSDRCGKSGAGSPPEHLEARIRAYEDLQSGRGRKSAGGITFSAGAFHKPGSNKK